MMTRSPLVQILQSITLIALPISAGRILNILANFVAMMMVAQISKDQLAAGFLAVSSTVAITTSILTVFYAIGIRIRFQRSQNNSPEDLGILVKNGLALAIIVTLPVGLLISQMDKMLLAIGQEPALVHLTKGYFFYAALGALPLFMMTVIGQFYVGIGKPSFALIIELFCFPLTVLFSYGFVLGHFGLPQLGLTGVSLAALCVQIVITLATLLVMYLNKDFSPYRLFKKTFLPSWPICRSILVLGMPIGIQFGGELGAMAIANYFMGYYGVDAMAALQIASQYSVLVIMLSVGLSQAVSLKISEIHGKNERDYPLISKYLNTGLLLLGLYLLPVLILFFTCSTFCAEFYMGKSYLRPDFEYLIHGFFALSALFLLLDGIRQILSGALRGLHRSQIATHINLAALWLISLPMSWFSVFIIKGGPIQLRIGFLSGFLFAVTALAFYLYKNLVTIGSFSLREKVPDRADEGI